MEPFALLDRARTIPEPADPGLAELGFAKWHDALGAAGAAIAEPCRAIEAQATGKALLAAIFGNSPFLTRTLVRHPATFARIVREGPEPCLGDLLAADGEASRGSDEDVMTALRQRRAQVALLVGIADIADVWALDEVTGALSAFAEAALRHAANHLIAAAVASGQLGAGGAGAPAESSGFVVIGMGKLGASELNYSSDIDLIILYDDERIDYRGDDHPQALFVALTRRLVRILQERTAQGHVFRTDLRLRPDPGATPPALSMAAAERYYESVGQNWERAALVKARTVAGDFAAGADFLDRISPFIWRKHLDFAAIADIHSIKRQITARYGEREAALGGHNIKLGRGGIREIEFFVQTQQLIAGGRDISLRTRRTLDGLDALAASGRIEPRVMRDLAAAYRYLRRLEHRLQMIDDEQTHTLPADATKLANLAAFMGAASTDAFGGELKGHLDAVVAHYARLFEREEPLGAPANLVFTGSADDPDTLDTLRGLGFGEAERVSERIRSWHHGRFAATRAARARELLTLLMPRLLRALSQTADPDAAFVKFDEFLGRLPAGVQLFSLFNENPSLLGLVAEIMGTAPRLADSLSHDATMFDAVLAPDFFAPLPGRERLGRQLDAALARARDYQDILDIARRWANEQKFRAGVQILRNASSAAAAGPDLSNLADVLVTRLAGDVAAQLAGQHGVVPGGSFAVVGLGKLGARELTPGSDLDLVLVYDFDPERGQSDGARPLPAPLYYNRLGQRLISALTALTGEGRLYHVDMRLRPTGNAGPVASRLDGFVRYQRETAWTWEHMALARARIVAAPTALSDRTDRAIRDVLCLPRERARLVRDVADMRRRIEKEHASGDPWNVKYAPGGLVDLLFVCQLLQLAHAARYPELVGGSTAEVIAKLARRQLIDAEQARRLTEAARLMIDIQGFLRLTISGTFDEAEAPNALRAALARAGGAGDIAELRERLLAAQRSVRAAYREHVGPPPAAPA